METLKTITIYDDEEYLRQISKEVDIKNDNQLENDIKVLEEYCENEEVLAMASVQLRIPKRLIYLKNTNLDIINKKNSGSASEEGENYNEARVLINPVIISREGLTEYWEACVSCEDLCGHVYRPYKIVLEYYDIKGNKYTEIFEGFECTVLSHEYDHLDGILHIDIADQVIDMPLEERKVFRKTHDYNIISKTGNYTDLLEALNNKKLIKVTED